MQAAVHMVFGPPSPAPPVVSPVTTQLQLSCAVVLLHAQVNEQGGLPAPEPWHIGPGWLVQLHVSVPSPVQVTLLSLKHAEALTFEATHAAPMAEPSAPASPVPLLPLETTA